MRLDQRVALNWPEYSRSTWQKYIKLGYVTLNGEVITSSRQTVSEDDVVDVSIPEKTDYSNETLPILFEDDDVIVVYKPAGVLTHSKGELDDEFTVADFFASKTSYHADTNRPGIIHRLDRDTSGVMLGVKNDAAAIMLQKQFQRRTVKKTYFAVVDGVPKQDEATIDVPIARNPNAPSTFKADPNGKSAQTYYHVEATDGKRSLVVLKPRTGRTHQLRVHMKHIGTPIHGDKIYGKQSDRLYLHAFELALTLPSGLHHVFTAPVPTSFAKQIEEV